MTDTVYRADGSTAQGTVLISWPAFTTADGKAVAAGSLSVQLGNGGAFTASLAPNTGAQPAGVYYKVIYQLQGQGPSTEYWVVPATTSTTIGAVRATLQPATIAAQVLTRDVADSSYVHVNGDQTISGAKSFASLSAGAFQGIQYVCQQPGSDIGAKFQSAYNNLPADSGGHQMGTISFDGCSGYYSWTTPVTMTGARVKVVGNNNTTGKIAIQCNTTNCLTLNIPGSSVTSDGSNGSIFQGFEMDGNSSIPNQCGITVSDVYNVKGQDLYMASFNGSGSSAFCVQSNAVHSSGTEGFALDHVMFNQNLHAVTYNNNSGQNGGASFGYGSWKAVRCFSGAPGADCINLTGGLLYGTRIELDANLNASNSAAVRVSGNWIPSGNPSQFWYNAIDLDTESACSNCTNQAVFDLASGTLATGFFRVHVNSFGQPVAMLSSGSTAATFSNIAVSAGDTQTTTHVGHHPLCSGDPSQSAIGGNNEVCLLPYDNTALAQQGMGINASYDRTGAKYVAKGGSGNGATFLLGGNAGTLDIYALPSNGTSDQAISTSNLSKYLSLHLTNNGLFGYQGSGYTGGYGSWYWNISNLGVFNTFGSYQVKGNTVIDSSRNATVNNLTVNGTCTGCGTAVNLSSPPAIGDTTPNSGAFTTLAADDLVSKSFPVVDVRALGAVGDGKLIPDNCSMTAGSNVVTCTGSAASPPMIATGPPFAAGDVGKTFWIPGAGNIGSNNYLVATITTYVSASQVKLSSNAINSVPRSSAMFGHDNYAAFCAASNCTSTTVPNNWYGWPRTGKQIHVPAGMYLTSHPIYVRNGDMWWGDGETASQVRLMSAVNSVMAICMNGNASAGTDTCTLDAFANGASQTTTVRGLFLANGSMNTDYVNGPVGIYVAPGTSNFKIYNSWFDMSSVAIFAKNTNGGMIVDNLCDTATGLSCVVLDGTYTGSGNEYTTNQFSTVISGLQTWGGFNSITLHGVIGVTIERLQSMFIVAEDISFGTSQSPLSNQGSESSRRVVIADSFFQRSANPSYSGDPNDSFIIFREDCISCTISGNTFANSYLYDVQTQSAVNLNGLLIANNQFKDSQMKTQTGVGAPSVFLGNTGNTGLVTITNNHWENSGSYGLMSNQSVNLYGNTCHNPFQRSTPASGGIAASSCWYLADGAVNSVARDNVTDSSTYGSVGIATAGGHGATLDSSGNRSQWSTCDVCVTDATGGVVKSTNERASNSG
ncbi:MAG TPA: hypothetical protein VMT56_04255, partial [Candidatus Bathyarchaeia archaeon]|nr:hypothetical protein [Candidatus Bathyarchaeia archaeon]